jgi:hypothetical protein
VSSPIVVDHDDAHVVLVGGSYTGGTFTSSP